MSKQDLLDVFEKFQEKHTFTPGQIVEWKRGCQNKNSPGPFIVVSVLDGTEVPIFDSESSSGSPYFREPLDIVLGTFAQTDGTFVTFHYDSRRFQPADGIPVEG